MARPSPEALEAASWVINMENGPERSRLYNGHMIRRRDVFQDSYRADDHTEANAWLIGQWEAARDWMLECDTCGHRLEAVESLRGTGAQGLSAAREIAANFGWICEPEFSRDTCPKCRQEL